MKKENKFLELLNSKGFYTALFTCLFAVLAIAAFVSIRNIDAISKLSTYGEKDQAEIGDYLQPAGIQYDTPISELESDMRVSRSGQNSKDAETDIKTQEKPESQTAPQTRVRQTEPQTDTKTDDKAPDVTKPEQKPEATSEAEEQARKAPNDNANPDGTQEKKEEAKEAPKEAPSSTPEQKSEGKTTSAFESFEDGDEMSWPLDGAIVMDFSTLHTIYDKTLDQYRTNPTVSISADVGTQVKAAADGIVSSVSIDPRNGNMIVLDHGNGWHTVYGQLQDTILVMEGDTVRKGQAIGGVGTPTKYGVLLGSHLVFGVNKDEVPQNPQLVLASNE